jgi:hypothetical protein
MEQIGTLLHLPAAAVQDPGLTLITALAVLGTLHHFKLFIRGLTLLVKHLHEELLGCVDAIGDFLNVVTGGRIGRQATHASSPVGGKRARHRLWKAYEDVKARAMSPRQSIQSPSTRRHGVKRVD